MSEEVKNKVVNEAKGLAKWLAVDIKISVLGVTIWEYHFPPKEDNV